MSIKYKSLVMTGSWNDNKKPRISILAGFDSSRGSVIVKLFSESNKTYVIYLKIDGCKFKTIHNVVIEPMNAKNILINISSQSIVVVIYCKSTFYMMEK